MSSRKPLFLYCEIHHWRMHESHLLHSNEFAMLADAYRLLRKIEHRLQMVYEQQVYELTGDQESQSRLAANMGFDDYESLKTKYDESTSNVRKLYVGVFCRDDWNDAQ